MTTFSEIVDAADSLSVDQQETLVEILRRRIAERNRAAIVQEVHDAREEHAQGQTLPTSASDLVKQALRES